MALTPSTPTTLAEKRAIQDAAEQDVLMREVDEAVRQGDFEDFMQVWGRKILFGVIAVLVIFGGYLFYQSRQEAALEAQSEQLIGAIDAIGAGNLAEGDKRLADLAAKGTDGAGASATMLRGGIALQQGKADEAAKLFAAVAANDKLPAEMRDLAKVREIAARYDTMDRAQVIAALKPLAVPGKPYFGSAGELLAHAYLDQGKSAEAGALFAQIAKDRDAPETLRARSRQLAGLLGVDAIEDVNDVLPKDDAAAAQ